MLIRNTLPETSFLVLTSYLRRNAKKFFDKPGKPARAPKSAAAKPAAKPAAAKPSARKRR